MKIKTEKIFPLTAQNLYDLYSPQFCEKRLYLSYKGETMLPPGPFEQLLFKLGRLHEQKHLLTLGPHADVSGGKIEKRAEKTKEYIKKETGVIYQGVFTGKVEVDDLSVEIVSIPDFLIYESCRWIIRDAKLARHVDEGRHPEIDGQLQLYGLLFEMNTGEKPSHLEVLQGDGQIVALEYSADSARGYLKKLVDIVKLDKVPYSPVGWSKCKPCGYAEICWPESVSNKDVAILPGVDQGLAVYLRNEGTATFENLLKKYNEETLSEVCRPYGSRTQRVGKAARTILLQAQALKEKRNIIISKIELPECDNYVMFDLEGIPQYTDDLEKIYLWGLKVYGKNPSPFIPALAGIGPDADKEVWEDFLENSRQIFEKYGDIPFIHYASYEKTKLKLYSERYGDSEAAQQKQGARGIAERVKKNLFDLFPALKKSVILPEPSYSLKVVEKALGFKRTQDEYGGDWAIARYIEAVETENEKEREEIMAQISKYNEEDLDATWEVFKWMKSLKDKKF